MAQWSYRQAWLCLVGSTFATLAVSLGLFWGWREWRGSRLHDARTKVVAIVQTGPEREALKTAYLAELLHLSVDQPTSLYALDLEKAKSDLMLSPIIADVKIDRIPPGTLYIDYTIRHPVAFLSDYQNTGIDHDGYLFPLAPFYSPKNLPEIFLGLPSFGEIEDAQGRKGGEWQKPLQNQYVALAMNLLEILQSAPWQEGMRVKRIDVSNAFASSAGLREIVLIVEDELTLHEQEREIVCTFPKILRLPTQNYAKQMGNFLSLRQTMLQDYQRQIAQAHYTQSPVLFAPRIIDLRLPQLAFVQNN